MTGKMPRRSAIVALVTWLCVCSPAWGEAPGWGGSVSATSDYVFRGVSQTSGGAAVQGDVHYQGQAGWFTGAWASGIDLPVKQYGHTELDLYAGWAWTPAPDWSARLSYVRYLYPGADSGFDYDYNEIEGSVGFRDRVYATLGWAFDVRRATAYGNSRGSAMYYELSARQPVWRMFGLAAGIGYYDLEQTFGDSYWAWNATATCTLGRFELDLARFDASAAAEGLFGAESAAGRWALTGIWRF